MSTRMLQRRGLASEWAATNPILGEGEIGFVKDTGELRIGDGLTAWDDLTSPYMTKSGGSVSGYTIFQGGVDLAYGAGVNASVRLGGDTGVYAKEHILVQDSTQSALIVKLAASQAADASKILDSTGATIASIASNGNIRAGQTDTSSGVRIGASAGLSETRLLGIAVGTHWVLQNTSGLLTIGSSASPNVGGGVSPRLSLGGNDMVWDYQGLGNQRFRFTSDGAVEYIQTDLGVVFSAVGSGSPRLKINPNGTIEAHGTTAGFQANGKDNDAQTNTFYTYQGAARIFNSLAGGDILIASNGSLGIYSNGLATLAAMNIGRNYANELNLGIAAGGGQFFSNAAAGDMFMRLIDSAKTIRLGTGTGGSIVDIGSNGAYVVGRVLASSRLSLYDDYAGLINAGSGRLTLYAYNGIEVRGGRASATVPTPATGSGSDASMYVYPASISQTALSLARFSSGQTADIFRVTEVGNSAVFFAIQNNGNLWLSGSSWLGSSISTGDTMHMSHATHGLISIAYAGVGEDNDNYGIIGITAPASVNRAYYSMTAAGNTVFGMGMGADNKMRLGSVNGGKIMGANVVTVDASGNLATPGAINDGSGRVYSPGNPPPGGSGTDSGRACTFAFHLGTLTTGWAIPKYILSKAITIKGIYAIAHSGSGAQIYAGYGSTVASPATVGTPVSSIGSSVVSATGQSIAVPAGYFLELYVNAVGTCSDVSVVIDAVYQ